MASSLLALIDDIASLLDDVSVLAKVAAKKTAGVLGDDLALNAQQVAGVRAERELAVVWAVAKGSVRNKVMLVPAALAISHWLPWAVTPLLMVGGVFLCFEGVEKLAHRFLHDAHERQAEHQALVHALQQSDVTLADFEKDRIRGAIRTDFILSAEIITIALATVQGQDLATQLGVLLLVSAAMTVGVYGLVAGIVKLDDAGLHLSRRRGDHAVANLSRRLGTMIIGFAPWLMKFLSVAGTAALFLVGGGILVHGLPVLDQAMETVLHALLQGLDGVVLGMGRVIFQGLVGVAAGSLALLAWKGVSRR